MILTWWCKLHPCKIEQKDDREGAQGVIRSMLGEEYIAQMAERKVDSLGESHVSPDLDGAQSSPLALHNSASDGLRSGTSEPSSEGRLHVTMRAQRNPETWPLWLAEASYFIVGSWDDCVPAKMTWDGLRYTYTFTMTRVCETFQLWVNGSRETAIYPSFSGATQFCDHWLSGPDDQGSDMKWSIGTHRLDPLRSGMRCKIALLFDPLRNPSRVSWERLVA